MAANYDQNPIISQFTTRYLEATGWYTVDPEYIRETNWGHRRTCSFIGTSSDDFCQKTLPEYVEPLEKKICTFDNLGKGVVEVSEARDFMENCKVVRIQASNESNLCISNLRSNEREISNIYKQEQFGPDSRCFMASYHHKNIALSDAPPLEAVCQRAKVRRRLKLTRSSAQWKTGS